MSAQNRETLTGPGETPAPSKREKTDRPKSVPSNRMVVTERQGTPVFHCQCGELFPADKIRAHRDATGHTARMV